MRIVCIADTHRKHDEVIVPEGDMLIFAGDGDWRTTASLNPFLDWLEAQPHKYKIMISGNHDFLFQEAGEAKRHSLKENIASRNIIYLQDSGAEVGGFNIWGSPYTPSFNDWAFNKDRGNRIMKVWDKIPDDTDILITHGPPMYTLDLCGGDAIGCYDLAKAIDRVNPKLHVFGHIHSQQGIIEKDGTIFVNASVVDEYYQVAYETKVVDL